MTLAFQKPEVIRPASGSRIVCAGAQIALFGQPPEVLKGLLLHKIHRFDTLVLTDVKEKDGSLLNNLEFPFYFFLFMAGGLESGRRLNIVGEAEDIRQAMRLLRFTLLGPTRDELVAWGTDPALRDEWLKVSEALALAGENGEPLPVEDFFNPIPFDDNFVKIGDMTITHTGRDLYEVTTEGGGEVIDLNDDVTINPTYRVQSDYVPGGLVKMGLEVLGGASGFTLDEPCTGLALCHNGDYLLIDALPFLDQNLFARGIAKNQVSAVFLTHLHDDHCAMFPLMMMPHRVDVITTPEIFHMAMEKLACNLGWKPEVISEHFNLIAVTPGESTNYYGLTIEPHVTVHSIPTIGATFTSHHKGVDRRLCIVGDNHSMSTIRDMQSEGIVRAETVSNLERIYAERFNMLVADGGAGAIHGDPADAIASDADRVIFVHVDELSKEFNTTFSLASSGKRYTILEGDPSLYMSQVNHYLTNWLGRPIPNRWMRSLLAEEDVRRFNQDDVIIVQNADTRGFVYLILTGYCDVVRHDGEQHHVIANLQAGDIIGEMAIVTGSGTRNASVVATTPVTVCVFSEEIFRSFIEIEKFGNELLRRWASRPVIKALPQFEKMSSTALEKLGRIAGIEMLDQGDSMEIDSEHWYLVASGEVELDGVSQGPAAEFGWRPFITSVTGTVQGLNDARIVRFNKPEFEQLRAELPQLNYLLRKFRTTAANGCVDWALGPVTTYQASPGIVATS